MLRIDTFERTRDVDIIVPFANNLFGRQVLEIGCGGGERTNIFVSGEAHVTAIDIIDVRKKDFLTNSYSFVIADGKDLPFEDESFDAVVSFDVIEHIDEDILFLSEIYRVCKKGGLLILGTPNRNRLSHKLRKMLGKKVCYPLTLGPGCIHLREYTMDDLNGLIRTVGFKMIKREYVWFGLLGLFGFKRFPSFLNKWVQYLLISAMKP